jgi:hypothetical protein
LRYRLCVPNGDEITDVTNDDSTEVTAVPGPTHGSGTDVEDLGEAALRDQVQVTVSRPWGVPDVKQASRVGKEPVRPICGGTSALCEAEGPEVHKPSPPCQRLRERRNSEELRRAGQDELPAILTLIDEDLDGANEIIPTSLDLVDDQRRRPLGHESDRIGASLRQLEGIIKRDVRGARLLLVHPEQRGLPRLTWTVDDDDPQPVREFPQLTLREPVNVVARHVLPLTALNARLRTNLNLRNGQFTKYSLLFVRGEASPGPKRVTTYPQDGT